MNTVWDAIDLSENLGRCLNVVRRMYGLQAAVMAGLVALMLVATSMLAWTFDIRTTFEATQTLVQNVNENIPYRFANYTSLIVLTVTFAPTLFELVGAAFAKEGSTPFQGVVIALSLFDLITDAPATTAFVNAHWPIFETFGIFAYPVYIVAWAFWLFCSSFFFEMITICLAVSLLGLILRAMSGSKRNSNRMSQA